ncbi:MAG: hypothetical protein HY900_20635 [Deltaproteobacteria bacterium]|nr:hypothetical protein [Deltaproteobacteria bacterium]
MTKPPAISPLQASAHDLLAAYEAWKRRRRGNGWGLTWYLAAELCERFYASHGIVPYVQEHEGLGYYGLGIYKVPCPAHGGGQHAEPQQVGRLTKAGDVENWITGGPGDHGLTLAERASRGEMVAPMVAEAVRHLAFPVYPEKSHVGCRHHRWGASYVLLFRLAALLALGHSADVYVANHPDLAGRKCRPFDPDPDQREHPGYFVLSSTKDREVLLRGDGRVLRPEGEASLWERYVTGEPVAELRRWLASRLGLRG